MSPPAGATPCLPVFHGSTAERHLRAVENFDALAGTPWTEGLHALCWLRELRGDFGEIVERLEPGPGITPVEPGRLRKLALSEAGQMARAQILEDWERLESLGLQPSLDTILGYDHEVEAPHLRTDVQSFHVDSATAPADTWLCTYHGASSEGLRHEDAIRRIDVPEMRAKLLEEHGGPDDAAFDQFLREHYLDLHYLPLPGARPYSFGRGHLWRIPCQYDGCPVPPCVHRAPDTVPGTGARLLMIC